MIIAQTKKNPGRGSTWNPNKGPQKYFSPELNTELKVEYLSNKKYVVTLPEGPERITYWEMTKLGWKHLGKWEEPTK